jgi:2'-5' RNA ligase
LRAFLAVPLPEGLQLQLQQEAARLRPLLPQVRWVRKEAMHLTVLFLGEMEEERIPQLAGLAESTCRQVPVDRLKVNGMGFFPERGPVRVLWVGVTDERGTLSRLHDGLGRCAREIGLVLPDGRFRGHLTLGRARGGLPRRRAQEAVQGEAPRFDDLPVQECILFRSTLGAGGARHDALRRFALGEAG